MDRLIAKQNYTSAIKYISGSYIYEYDIRQANINMLYSYGKIDKYQYDRLAIMDKMDREVIIGNKILKEKMENPQQESDSYQCISQGISYAKIRLQDENKFSDDKIYRIASDAVFLNIQIPLKVTEIQLTEIPHKIKFVNKNCFTSAIVLGRLTILYGNNGENSVVEVKGINDTKLPLLQDFLSFICEILYYMELGDKTYAINRYHQFYNQYVRRELPITYYRELNSGTSYRIMNSSVGALFLDQDKLPIVDITYNLAILRQLYSLIMQH